MDDVAKRAGVGVGTVYRHFPTKEALVYALALELFTSLLAAAREALRDRGSVGGVHRPRCGPARELLASDRAFTEIAGEAEMPISAELQTEINDDLRRRSCGARRRRVTLRADLRARRHPDVHVRDRHGDRQAALLPGRLAAPPHARHRRAARGKRLAAAPDLDSGA